MHSRLNRTEFQPLKVFSHFPIKFVRHKSRVSRFPFSSLRAIDAFSTSVPGSALGAATAQPQHPRESPRLEPGKLGASWHWALLPGNEGWDERERPPAVPGKGQVGYWQQLMPGKGFPAQGWLSRGSWSNGSCTRWDASRPGFAVENTTLSLGLE